MIAAALADPSSSSPKEGKMPVDVGKTLLTTERQRLDRQIGAIEMALEASDGRSRARPRGSARANRKATVHKARRRRMSAAGKKAVSQRMKAYWAKRRVQSGKNMRTTGKKQKEAAAGKRNAAASAKQ